MEPKRLHSTKLARARYARVSQRQTAACRRARPRSLNSTQISGIDTSMPTVSPMPKRQTAVPHSPAGMRPVSDSNEI
ncbi:hypothetical protein VM94_05355 [Janthinobacterium sp. KBS0711]|nr:hypothetical protein VM94_05355 [Janthinobacterium sp. KBS0711]